VHDGARGHTIEILSLIETLNLQWYAPKYYRIAITNNMNLMKAKM
jgi:hypothetical protein